MNPESAIQKIQRSLDAITRKWWLYLLLTLLFFLRPYVSRAYDPRESLNIIMQALMDPLIFGIPILMPIAKALTVLLVLALFVLGNKVRKLFDAYIALLYGAIAYYQHTAWTESYGLVVVTSNLVLIGIVALLWGWEIFSGLNDFKPRKIPRRKWWVVPFALLAFLAPIDSSTLAPNFHPMHMLTNEAGLTYCMMTPVILSILTLYHPTINLALLRASAFVGILFGAVNMIVWFLIYPIGWWMGVLHIPLITIAVYAFVLAHRNVGVGEREEHRS
jgi:hypothetical protein